MPERKNKILVVDDDERNLRIIEAMLIPQGYDVLLTQNGYEALKMAKEQSPDVILLDIMMPQIDGFEVARQLKEIEDTRIIPIVMVTAYNPRAQLKARNQRLLQQVISPSVRISYLRNHTTLGQAMADRVVSSRKGKSPCGIIARNRILLRPATRNGTRFLCSQN